jgi:copper chaperone CopZ
MTELKLRRIIMPSIKIQGMHCDNCKKAVSNALAAIPGLSKVQVDLAGGKASFEYAGPGVEIDLEKIKETVRNLGFEA